MRKLTLHHDRCPRHCVNFPDTLGEKVKEKILDGGLDHKLVAVAKEKIIKDNVCLSGILRLRESSQHNFNILSMLKANWKGDRGKGLHKELKLSSDLDFLRVAKRVVSWYEAPNFNKKTWVDGSVETSKVGPPIGAKIISDISSWDKSAYEKLAEDASMVHLEIKDNVEGK